MSARMFRAPTHPIYLVAVGGGARAFSVNFTSADGCHGPCGAGLSREDVHADWSDGAGVPVPRSGAWCESPGG